QTYTESPGSEKMTGTVTVDKTGGKVLLGTAMSCNGDGQALNITEGTLDLNGHDLTVGGSFSASDGGNLTVADGGNLQLQGSETITADATILNDGSTVTYVGNGDGLATNFTMKNLTYSNLTINATDGTDTFSLPGVDITASGTLTL